MSNSYFPNMLQKYGELTQTMTNMWLKMIYSLTKKKDWKSYRKTDYEAIKRRRNKIHFCEPNIKMRFLACPSNLSLVQNDIDNSDNILME